MALSFRDISVGRSRIPLVDTFRGYFVRYRLALYLLSVAAVALGVAVNWNWLTAAALFRVVAVLPCALMMFRCVRHGIHGSNAETKSHSESRSSELSHDDERHDAWNDVGHGVCVVAGRRCPDPGSGGTH